jgi:hypothetical protein
MRKRPKLRELTAKREATQSFQNKRKIRRWIRVRISHRIRQGLKPRSQRPEGRRQDRDKLPAMGLVAYVEAAIRNGGIEADEHYAAIEPNTRLPTLSAARS